MNRWEKEVLESLLGSEEEALKELERQYARALADINQKIKLFQADIDLLDQALSQDGLDDATKALLQSRKRSKVYQQQYQQALQGQVGSILDKMHGDNYATIDKYLHSCYETGYIGTMYDIAKQGIPVIVPIDQAAVIKAILTDSKVSGGLYNRLGVDVGKLKKTITQEISRGIATGMGYGDIARNIRNVSGAPMSRTKTIARTEGHRIQQTSAVNAQQKAKAKGADVLKQWDAALDGRTRDSHRQVDGEIKELDEKFSNGLMFPGDPNGGAAEVVNCRCTSNTRARWALGEEELQTLKERAEYFGLDKTEGFEDYKKKYLKAAEAEGQKSEPQKAEKGQAASVAAKEELPTQQTGSASTTELERLNTEEKRLNGVVSDTEGELDSYKKMLDENLKKADASEDFAEWMRLSEEEEKLRDSIKAANDKLREAKEGLENVKREKPWAPYSEPYLKAQTPTDVADELRKKAYFATDKINMEGVSLDGAKTIATALDRCFSEYPEMAGKIKGITISKRNQDGASYNNVTHMLEIGPDFFSGSIEEMRERYAKMVKSGYAPKGSDYRGIIVHEFGHAIDQQISGSNALASGMYYGDFLEDAAGFKSIMSKGVSDYVKENISRYAEVSPIECFAECFNEYICSPKPRKMATWYGERIDKFFGKTAGTVENAGKSGTMKLQLFAEKDLSKQKTLSLKKGMASFQEQIIEHRRKIERPWEYVPGWNEKDEREQEGLKRHWEKEIRTFQQSIENRVEELRKRGEYDE